ncbi:hypothetical protein HOH87_08145 [bacterium]|jgi:hypothetical protein|nr:hypothetical protein [bacterium]
MIKTFNYVIGIEKTAWRDSSWQSSGLVYLNQGVFPFPEGEVLPFWSRIVLTPDWYGYTHSALNVSLVDMAYKVSKSLSESVERQVYIQWKWGLFYPLLWRPLRRYLLDVVGVGLLVTGLVGLYGLSSSYQLLRGSETSLSRIPVSLSLDSSEPSAYFFYQSVLSLFEGGGFQVDSLGLFENDISIDGHVPLKQLPLIWDQVSVGGKSWRLSKSSRVLHQGDLVRLVLRFHRGA